MFKTNWSINFGTRGVAARHERMSIQQQCYRSLTMASRVARQAFETAFLASLYANGICTTLLLERAR